MSWHLCKAPCPEFLEHRLRRTNASVPRIRIEFDNPFLCIITQEFFLHEPLKISRNCQKEDFRHRHRGSKMFGSTCSQSAKAILRPRFYNTSKDRRRQRFIFFAVFQKLYRFSVTTVTGHQFVTAFARQNYLYMLLRKLRNKIKRHARNKTERFVFVPNQLRQCLEKIARGRS